MYAATYLGNSPQTLYGSGWKRLDGNRSFSYETSVSMPAATYRVVCTTATRALKMRCSVLLT